MTSMLESVVTNGTGRGIRDRGFTRPCAGKTGTTNDFTDAWFIGFTPQLITSVWVGFDEIRSMGKGMVGGTMALPIWTEFMIQAHKDLPEQTFAEVSNGLTHATICERSGMLAGPYCQNTTYEVFIAGTEPVHSCEIHLTPMATGGEDSWHETPGQNKQIHNELEF